MQVEIVLCLNLNIKGSTGVLSNIKCSQYQTSKLQMTDRRLAPFKTKSWRKKCVNGARLLRLIDWTVTLILVYLRPHYTKEYLWRISPNFLHTCHSSSILLCISSKNMWRICEEYVTAYCLKFYIILNKFKSVWVYPKLWRILNNRMTLTPLKLEI